MIASRSSVEPGATWTRDSHEAFRMAATDEPLVLPEVTHDEDTKSRDELEPGFLVICWNDPVNFTQYVTHVFQQVFGWPKEKAEKHMLEVHEKGRSVLTRESLERAEHYVHQLQGYALHATMEPDR
ncbi:MAG TPA: ATP-dependent Clp protease adaptor ClpS [Verrucomicrobiae bacterium]|nr:ATP-dependent Clp protease adaptor ClpS [Verrucomicrobiae bacterium]